MRIKRKIANILKSNRPIYWPTVYAHWKSIIPPRRLWVNPNDTLVHFLRWPWEYRAYLTLLCNMRQDHSVLELGCNHGRTMLGLLDYLKSPRKYEGLDILPEQIEFAKNNIHSDHFSIGFTLADISNGLYNPGGKCQAAEYKFPYKEDEFDIAYAASLFTHLLPKETLNYFMETRRVLKKSGLALYSVFILDYYQGPGTPSSEIYQFDNSFPGYDGVAVYDAQTPETVIAYSEETIRDMAEQAGLEVQRIVPGYWSGNSQISVNEQDLVVLGVI